MGAGANFLDNGVVSVEAKNHSAHLNLDSYIGSAMGKTTGKFELVLTISPTVGTWLSLGFAVENAPNTNKNFTNTGSGTEATTILANVPGGDATRFFAVVERASP